MAEAKMSRLGIVSFIIGKKKESRENFQKLGSANFSPKSNE